ncbi:hypothetical protein EDB92DRAFT_1899204 [Lactarius akahatsu]|uniref:Chromatin modification-related protein n=1 Tax=Lactarius akahatsu TaxID=416441 RepID=A0AAD4L765_9AGAM|nr:hypothetical protein EDB92DRAFT_1899204 [Lactarius akahatsu]
MEEAAAVAMDYITTLDNLPAEVQHLLVEIKHKETKSQELLQEITKETSRYIRHSLRSGATPLSTKDEQIPQKIDQNYAEVDRLAQEKLKIAERLGLLIQRARTRLDYDLRRVLILQGDDPGQPAFVSTSRNPVQEINDSLRLAIADAAPIIPPAPVVLSAVQPPVQKKRKVTATVAAASIKLPSPAPATVPVLPQRTRLAQQQSHRASPARGRQAQPEPPGPDEDAEGEDDVEEGNGDEDEDNEDKTLYCFCQKMSYGEMVACDNAECAYQWFHLPCVNLKPPLPEVWYCSDCISKGVAGSSVDNAGPERTKKRKR